MLMEFLPMPWGKKGAAKLLIKGNRQLACKAFACQGDCLLHLLGSSYCQLKKTKYSAAW